MKVKLISLTLPINSDKTSWVDLRSNPEALMSYCAKVSSKNQDNPNYVQLLKYCILNGHWSVFEMADMTIEIVTSRAIAAQILRHKSFSFQEHSQRYSEALDYEPCLARRQDLKNRQNSIDDLPDDVKESFLFFQQMVWEFASERYKEALSQGIAKECARMLLPLNTQTRLYMKGSVRSWIHYLQTRCDGATQLEHRAIADSIKGIFIEQFPTISAALDWSAK